MKQISKPVTVSPFNPGDRVLTPTGQAGTVQPSPWLMPHHHLVRLDHGRTAWILRELLAPEPDGAA